MCLWRGWAGGVEVVHLLVWGGWASGRRGPASLGVGCVDQVGEAAHRDWRGWRVQLEEATTGWGPRLGEGYRLDGRRGWTRVWGSRPTMKDYMAGCLVTKKGHQCSVQMGSALHGG